MSFESGRNAPTQEHFYLVSVFLPTLVSGKCEISSGVEGYGTPLSCPLTDVTTVFEDKEYIFATTNTPILQLSVPVYRCISGLTESGTELKNGEGLAIRGRASITFADFMGDPNPENAQSAIVADQGTFFGKFRSRNIFENKKVYIRKYRKGDIFDLSDLATGETTAYLGRELTSRMGDKYTLDCADALSNVDFNQTKWPPQIGGELRLDVSNSSTILAVDGVTDWTQKSFPYEIRIGDELMTITGVNNNLSPTATLSVSGSRGTPITLGAVQVSESTPEDHSAGDDVFICESIANTGLANLLQTILTDVGIPSSTIDLATWQAEVDLWHDESIINTVFSESEATNAQIKKILEGFMFDMWVDPKITFTEPLGSIKLTAISAWQSADLVLVEGAAIDYQSVTVKDKEVLRFSRAQVAFNKANLTAKEEIGSYKSAVIAVRATVEGDDFYGKEKTKKFENNTLIGPESAGLLCNRYVNRYGTTPKEYKWTTQERFLTFLVGDVVEVQTESNQGFDGGIAGNSRAQITKIQPVYGQFGRQYNVQALQYLGAFGGDNIWFIAGGVNVNLNVRAGAPPVADTFTFIITGDILSNSLATPSLLAGNFPAGSTIVIILRDGARIIGRGGEAGKAELITGWNASHPTNGGFITDAGTDGENGGISYDSYGHTTNIYISGTDPEGGVSDGALLAAGGGGGAAALTADYQEYNFDGFGSINVGIGGGGGGGGAGFPTGDGGAAGSARTVEDGFFAAPTVFDFPRAGDEGNELTGGDTNSNQAGFVQWFPDTFNPSYFETLTGVYGGRGGDLGEPGIDGMDSAVTGFNPETTFGTDGGDAGKAITGSVGTVTLYGATLGVDYIQGGGDTPTITPNP